MAQDRSYVIGVTQAMLNNDAGYETVEVVVVGLCTSEGSDERAESRRHHGRGMLRGSETGALQQVDETVALGLRCDGLDFRGEAVDTSMEFVLGFERL
ncbi:hypothetical protein [Nocardioides sp. WS12]|uniref:hypothetical protein n=1 Tax=Nocardioides sp. WS12 TaxID=2486272 RepID=UPI0015F8856B|nr:hypothetical protein [Nocardioides sp. WS12]